MTKRPAVLALLLFAACSAMNRPSIAGRQLTGEGGDVHVDARVTAQAHAGEPIAVSYVITNERPAPITIADVAAQTTYDAENHTATLKIGAAAPAGAKRIRLAPGEKKTFNATARIEPSGVSGHAAETLLRLQVHFMDDGRPESVYTNAIPAYR